MDFSRGVAYLPPPVARPRGHQPLHVRVGEEEGVRRQMLHGGVEALGLMPSRGRVW